LLLHSDGGKGPASCNTADFYYIYGGAVTDLKLLGYLLFSPENQFGLTWSAIAAAYGIADLPFSIALDTLILPLCGQLFFRFPSKW